MNVGITRHSTLARNSTLGSIVYSASKAKYLMSIARGFILVVVCVLTLVSCSETNDAIDSTFTFNIDKNNVLPFPSATPTNLDITNPFPLSPDSIDYANNKTTVANLKSAKLTRMTFMFSDATYTMADNIDTVVFYAKSTTLPELVLGYYRRSVDSIYYTNADFVQYLQDISASYHVTFRLVNAPSANITATTSHTIVLTAK